MVKTTKKKAVKRKLSVEPVNWKYLQFTIEGTTPYVQKPRGGRGPYRTKVSGRYGIPCMAIHDAMSRGRLHAAGQILRAWKGRLGLAVEAEAYDMAGIPIVLLDLDPVEVTADSAEWGPGWQAQPVIRYDADQLSERDLLHLLQAATEIGLGFRRPNRRDPDREAPSDAIGRFRVVL